MEHLAKTRDEYQKALIIDKHDLDNELINQPGNYCNVAMAAAHAESVAAAAKEDMKCIEAETERRLRLELEEKLGKKPTEAQLNAEVLLDEPCRAARAILLQANASAAQWCALKEAWQQRVWVLRDVVAVFIAGYYSENAIKGPREAKENAAYEANRKAMAEKRTQIQRRALPPEGGVQ